MALLAAVLVSLLVIAVLYGLAGKVGVPYPTLFVLGGLALAFVPGLPRLALEPDLILLVFLPPLLFIAATETPTRELRRWLWPIVRLAFLLVLLTMVVVAVVAQTLVPTFGWAAALTFGAILAPTDALAATSVFRRLGLPRVARTLIEGEALFNDALSLVAYRAGVLTVASGGALVLATAVGGVVFAVVAGIAIGFAVGWVAVEVFRRLEEPTVEVVLSVVVPFAAYLPADYFGASGVLASVTAGLVVGSQLSKVLGAQTRVLWLSTWKMIGFVLNGFVFVLIGLQLPEVVAGLMDRNLVEVLLPVVAICAAVILTRFVYVYAASYLPNSAARQVAEQDAPLAGRLKFIVGWSGMRGAVSLAAALALPANFPERDLILLTTFVLILITLVGQGATLPLLIRRDGWDGAGFDADEGTAARALAYRAGLYELGRQREKWSSHAPLFDRLESGLNDRLDHLETHEGEEDEEHRKEREEHEQIQQAIIDAERTAVIALRDAGEINDETLREIEREFDLEELRMEG
jgi:CPA1 family monovalent cation:H+ antiporter